MNPRTLTIGEGYLHGTNGIAEGVRLIRGTSTTQPPGVRNVLVTAGTGVPTSALILSGHERARSDTAGVVRAG